MVNWRVLHLGPPQAKDGKTVRAAEKHYLRVGETFSSVSLARDCLLNIANSYSQLEAP